MKLSVDLVTRVSDAPAIIYLNNPLHIRINFYRKIQKNEKMLSKEWRKKNIIFTDIGQTKVYPPPSYPIFDNLFFDKVHLIWAPSLLIEFLTTFFKNITGNMKLYT